MYLHVFVSERLSAYQVNGGTNGGLTSPLSNKPVSPIPEISPGDSVTALCQQLSQGLSQLTHSNSDDFNFNNQLSINQNQNQNNLTVSGVLPLTPVMSEVVLECCCWERLASF